MESTQEVKMSTAIQAAGSGDDKIAVDEKKTASALPKEGEVEVLEEEPEKTYYSSLSVWLMVLFSGLAIGSDG